MLRKLDEMLLLLVRDEVSIGKLRADELGWM